MLCTYKGHSIPCFCEFYEEKSFAIYYKTIGFYIWYVYVYFCKVNIWNVNCAQATAFIFDLGIHVLACESVEGFETENVSARGDSTLRFMSNALTIWAIGVRYFLFQVLEHWLWQYILYMCNIYNISLKWQLFRIVKIRCITFSSRIYCSWTAEWRGTIIGIKMITHLNFRSQSKRGTGFTRYDRDCQSKRPCVYARNSC